MTPPPPLACTGGRPPGHARQALLAALQAGVTGTFDAIARHAGVPERQARHTLDNLRRAGVVQVHRPPHHSQAAEPQRLRHVYAPSRPVHHVDALRFVAQVWR